MTETHRELKITDFEAGDLLHYTGYDDEWLLITSIEGWDDMEHRRYMDEVTLIVINQLGMREERTIDEFDLADFDMTLYKQDGDVIVHDHHTWGGISSWNNPSPTPLPEEAPLTLMDKIGMTILGAIVIPPIFVWIMWEDGKAAWDKFMEEKNGS